MGIWHAAFVGTKLFLSSFEFKKNGAVKGPVAPTKVDRNEAIAPITRNLPLNSILFWIFGYQVKNKIATDRIIVDIIEVIVTVKGTLAKEPIPAPIAKRMNIFGSTFLIDRTTLEELLNRACWKSQNQLNLPCNTSILNF